MKTRNGFTLIETLVALVITVAAGLLIANSWSGNYVRTRKTALNNIVAVLLERKAVELEAKYTGKKIDEIKDEEGDFGKDFPNYRWKFTAQPFQMPDLSSILNGDENQAADPLAATILTKMQEVVNKTIAEGKITIFANVNNQTREFSVTLYFVDYESDIPIGM
jgi:general secretion pathway protein I